MPCSPRLFASQSRHVHPARKQLIALRERGQGMTEYIIIVALIAVAAIAVYQFFGQTIRSQTSGIAQEVAGQSAKTAIDNAKTAADKAVTEGTTSKGLSNYQNDNARESK